jgi:hypothetical protein
LLRTGDAALAGFRLLTPAICKKSHVPAVVGSDRPAQRADDPCAKNASVIEDEVGAADSKHRLP